MPRALSLAAALLCLLSACGAAPPPVFPAAPAQRVVLVQIDGLTPERLDRYLSHPDARSPDRAIHAWLGLGEGGAQPWATTGHIVRGATTEPPGTGAATLATALTGEAPAVHRVWADGDTPSKPTLAPWPTANTLPKALPKRGALALRFDGLARALRADGAGADGAALADIDRRLHAWLPALPADTIAVVVGGHGVVLPPKTAPRDVAVFAKALSRKDAAGIHGLGGLVVFDQLTEAERARFDQVDIFTALLRKTDQGLMRWDADLQTLRPLVTADGALHAAADAAPAGAWIGVVNRAEGFDVRPGAGPTKAMWGGLTPAELRVALAFAGPGLKGRQPPPGQWTMRQLNHTLRGLLGQAARGDGDRSAALRQAAGPQPGVPRLEGDSARVHIPFVQAFGGPTQLSVPAGTAPDRAMAQLTALAQGVAAARAGLWRPARAALDGVKGLPAEAEAWRAFFRWWVALRGDAEDEGEDGEALPGPPPPKGGYPGALAAAIDSDLPTVSLKGFGPEREAILRALGGERTSALALACAPGASDPGAKALTYAQTLAARGLAGYAAETFAVAAMMAADPAQAQTARAAAVKALRAPGAAWALPSAAMALNGVALAYLGRPGDADRRAAAAEAVNLLLVHLQRVMAQDQAPGAADRNINRLAPLAVAAGGADPALLHETISLALGDDRALAGPLVAAVIAHGGLTQLLSGNAGIKLQSMARMVDDILGPLNQAPLKDLSPEDRLAAALGMLVRAASKFMQGNMADAFGALSAADDGLSDAVVLALRAKALGQPEADRSALHRWAPAVALLGRVGKAVAFTLVNQDGPARQAGKAAVGTVKAWLDAEVADAKAQATLGPAVDQLAGLLDALVDLVTAPEAQRAPAVAQALKRAAALRVALPAADAPGGELARWLSLLTVLARDTLFVVQAADGAAPDAKSLAAATADLAALAQGWTFDSNFANAGLLLGLAAQRSLQDLPALLKADDLTLQTAAARLPRLVEALHKLRADIEARQPAAARKAAVERGELGPWLLDVLAAILDAGPKALSEEGALLAVIEATIRGQLAAVRDTPGHTLRPILALADGWLLAVSDKPADAAALMRTARGWVDGTALEGQGWLMDLHAVRFALDTDDPALALAAADRADGACPGLGWHTALTRALRADTVADARAHLRGAIAQAAQRRTGPYKVGLKVMVVDDHDIVNANIELQAAGLAVGGGSGTFQLGAGASTDPDETTGVTVSLSGDGAAHAFAAEALLLEAWIALSAGDDGAADEALAALTDLLWYGTDPGLLAAKAAPSPAGGAAQVPLRDPLSALWVLALADARGHSAVVARLAQVLRQQGEVDQGPYGSLSVCDDDEAEDEAQKPLSQGVRCMAPQLLRQRMPRKARTPFARYAHLMARTLDGLPVKPRALAKARKAAARAWRAVPAKAPVAAAAVQKALAGKGDAAAALESPYRCGSVGALLQDDRITPAQARPVAQACGPIAVRFMALANLPADYAPGALASTAQLIARMGRLYPQARVPLWAAVSRWVRRAKSDVARVARARMLAQTARDAGDLDAAFDLDALSLAAKVAAGQPADATPLLDEAVGGARGSKTSRRFVKALHFKPAMARAEAARLLGLK